MPSSSASGWPEDEPLVEDTNMNEFCDELAHALFYGAYFIFAIIKDLYV